MEPIRFDPDQHTDMINGWCDKWGMSHFPDGWLPTVGYIVPDVAYASLYISDSSVAWLENLISNPEADNETRDRAIDAITAKVAETAAECGSKWLRGSSTHKAVLDRAEQKHGFWVDPRPSRQIMKALKGNTE